MSALGQVFNIPTFLVGYDNQTYGDIWSTLSNVNENATFFWLPRAVNTFQHEEFLNQIDATGRKTVIIAALTADAVLIRNVVAA